MSRMGRGGLELVLLALILGLAGWLRLRDLDRFIASDEVRWTCRSVNFHAALAERDWGATFQVGHPGVITMWLGSLALPLDNVGQWRTLCRATDGGKDLSALDDEAADGILATIAPLLFRARRGVGAGTLVLLAALYARLRRGVRLRPAPALAGLAVLGLDPFLLAHSRVLHLDAVLSLLALTAVVALAAGWAGREARSGGDGQGRGGRSNAGQPHDVWWRDRWWRNEPLLSGALAGLAMLAKVSGVLLGPLALAHFAYQGWRERDWRGAGRRCVVWGIAAAVGGVLLWPAMWVDPLGTLVGVLAKAETEGGVPHASGNYFMGAPVEDPGALFYPLAALYRLTPWGGLGLLAALWLVAGKGRGPKTDGEVAAPPASSDPTALSPPSSGQGSGPGQTTPPLQQRGRGGGRSAPGWGFRPVAEHPSPGAPGWRFAGPGPDIGRLEVARRLIGLLLAWALFFGLCLTIGPKKFDRYLLPALAALNLAGGVALGVVATDIARRRASGGGPGASPAAIGLLPFGVVIGLVAGQAWAALRSEPYYLAYYNPLLGGARTAERVLLVGWGEGYDLAADWLNGLAGADELEVSVRGVANFAPLFRGRTRSAPGYRPGRTDYVVLYISQAQRRQNDDLLARYLDPAGVAPAYVGRIAGIDYVWVYPNATVPLLRAAIAARAAPGDVLVAGGETVFARHYEEGQALVRYWGHWGEAEMKEALSQAFPADWARAWVIRYPGYDPPVALEVLATVARPGETVVLADGQVELTPFTRAGP